MNIRNWESISLVPPIKPTTDERTGLFTQKYYIDEIRCIQSFLINFYC